MRNIAVVLAGGFGQRLGDATPKQFLKLAGKKVIEHTIDVFQNHPLIDEIVVVSNPNYVQEVENILVKNEYSKMKKILKGGKERYHSSLAAINAYEEEVNMIFPFTLLRTMERAAAWAMKYSPFKSVFMTLSYSSSGISRNENILHVAALATRISTFP